MKEKPITSTSIRWPTDLKAKIEELAHAEDRTFSGYVIHVMRQHVARELTAKPRKS
jgi:predicted transcriptional regulator